MSDYIASAVFRSFTAAANALSALHALGIPNSAVSVLTPEGVERNGDRETGTSSLRQLLGSGALGAGLGVAALAIPGVGPLAAAGAIAATAVPGSVAVGATAGGLASLLGLFGIDEKKAQQHDKDLHPGAVLLLIDAQGTGVETGKVQDVLDQHGGFGRAML